MKEIIFTERAPKAIGPYSQAVKKSNMLFTSGQLGIDESGNFVSELVELQTVQSLKNIQAVLTQAGFSMSDVVKTTVFVADLNDFAIVNEQYAKFFPENPPARSCVEVSRLPKNALVEIEVVAIK